MYIINDIDLLKRLGRHKILDFILTQCKVGISAIRLTDYSLIVKREIEKYPAISVINVDDNFSKWAKVKKTNLSISDMSSLYVTLLQNDSTLVLSEEDIFMKEGSITYNVMSIQFDEFVIRTIKDEKIIQLYNLIKVA